MRVMGIDPGTATLGWGVIEQEGNTSRAIDYGAILTPAGLPDDRRLAMLYEGLVEIRDSLKPTWAAVEKLYFGQNSRTAMVVGQARGVVLLTLALADIPYVEMAPTEVKQAVTGYGRADKRQVQAMVQRLLGLAEIPKPDDVADALAIALCGAQTIRFRKWTGT